MSLLNERSLFNSNCTIEHLAKTTQGNLQGAKPNFSVCCIYVFTVKGYNGSVKCKKNIDFKWSTSLPAAIFVSKSIWKVVQKVLSAFK